MNMSRWDRQIRAFGEEGQRRIASTRVGVVGVGGIGSQIIQSLGYLGVEVITILDHDHVDITNLNRLVGAGPADAEQRVLKVAVAQRLLRQINPSIKVHALPYNLRTRQSIEALLACDIIFGCVDRDGPRLILTEVAAAYEITLIDAATELGDPAKDPEAFGGRAVVARPGHFCLFCANQIDADLAKWELLSPSEKESRAAHGYGLGPEVPAPSVISLNGIVANLAVTEFVMLRTGLREPNRMVTYKGMRGVVTRTTDDHRPDCYVCGYLVGQRERANVFRYANVEPGDTPSSPRTVPGSLDTREI